MQSVHAYAKYDVYIYVHIYVHVYEIYMCNIYIYICIYLRVVIYGRTQHCLTYTDPSSPSWWRRILHASMHAGVYTLYYIYKQIFTRNYIYP